MKIRTSPVSNSSSSSFIIGMALIKKDEFNKILKNLSPKEQVEYGSYDTINGMTVYTKERVFEEVSGQWGDFSLTKNQDLIMESFTGDQIIVNIKDMTDEDRVITLSTSSGDSDSDFWDEESEEYNYDIDESFFDDETIKKAEYIVSLGGSYTYGAGRNG